MSRSSAAGAANDAVRPLWRRGASRSLPSGRRPQKPNVSLTQFSKVLPLTVGTAPLAAMISRHEMQRGYVAATSDYRLVQQQPADADQATIALLQPLHDLKAAVRFFREDAATSDRYGTDGVNVFAAGVSAGAVLALTSAVLDETDPLSPGVRDWLAANGGLDGNSSANAGLYSSEVQAALSISGAIGELAWIDAKSAPVYAAHEEFDPVVPCGTGTADLAGFMITAIGACDAIPALDAAGVATAFFFVEGATTHVGYDIGELTAILDGAAMLFASLL